MIAVFGIFPILYYLLLAFLAKNIRIPHVYVLFKPKNPCVNLMKNKFLHILDKIGFNKI